MKSRKEIAQNVNEKIAIINDLLDEIADLSNEISESMRELYPEYVYDVDAIKNANDRLIARTAYQYLWVQQDYYTFHLEMMEDESAYAKWQWFEILGTYYRQCENFWKTFENGMLDNDEARHMAYLDFVNTATDPCSPNGQDIPEPIKIEYINLHLLDAKDTPPVKLDKVNTLIERGYSGWEKYKQEYYPEV